jgi:hypothetical protein
VSECRNGHDLWKANGSRKGSETETENENERNMRSMRNATANGMWPRARRAQSAGARF